MSVYSPRLNRVEVLSKIIGKSHKTSAKEKFRSEAERLVQKDEKEIDNEFGQNVRDTFPLADIFVRMSHESEMRVQICRFVEIIFGHPSRTPTRDELGMFYARAAALRSADLSRQVGSAITVGDGDIVAVGCNEVPKATGGFYWEGDKKDYRDFQIGYDSSTLMKHEILSELFHILQDSEILHPDLKEIKPDELMEQSLYGAIREKKAIFKDARISSIIEYGRIVHAEMAAITDAARRGISVESATLYCTTFPCHLCARHIISSGISRVIYIEPYPKSMAKNLYDKAIHVDGGEADDDAVLFDAFIGIAPRRFIQCFQMKKRKDDKGNALHWESETATPHIRRVFPTYLEIESSVGAFLADNSINFGISPE